MYHQPPRFPFTLTRNNQHANGTTESETHFEGFATYFEDEQTECSTWEVEAWVTGFTQYKDGKAVASVTGLKSENWTVQNLQEFKAACIDAACFKYQSKAA